MGGRQETFAGLTGVGDLIVTCCSMHSRNRRCGILIGQGVPVEQALQQSGGVVEGYYAAATARTLAQKLGVEMPIAQSAYEVLYQGKDPQVVLKELMTREKKHEIEQSWVQRKK
jgi:glycerol-3-phosphate dehydrogenase (NAD(P)+)